MGSRDQSIEDRTLQSRNLGMSEEEIAEYDFDADLEQEPVEDTEPQETPPSVRQGEGSLETGPPVSRWRARGRRSASTYVTRVAENLRAGRLAFGQASGCHCSGS
ncbi:hypothetical protein GCM10025876_31440 [Demequina litorisediminis]|uniref:Uncharacterized protein n=1 Tax=Demequina litorisediminis TaxID=1849022 RepID=A0ABQ6IGB8_9MICO|nr:hypothetical protein GCM10025876_31440 [Demequina litorisediminis]